MTTTRGVSSEVMQLRQRLDTALSALGLSDNNLGSIFKLPQSSARLLGLLMALPNITADMAQQQLEITTNAKVAIHRLRQELELWCEEAKVDYILTVRSRRTLGYWLDAETKGRIRALITLQGDSAPLAEPRSTICPDIGDDVSGATTATTGEPDFGFELDTTDNETESEVV